MVIIRTGEAGGLLEVLGGDGEDLVPLHLGQRQLHSPAPPYIIIIIIIVIIIILLLLFYYYYYCQYNMLLYKDTGARPGPCWRAAAATAAGPPPPPGPGPAPPPPPAAPPPPPPRAPPPPPAPCGGDVRLLTASMGKRLGERPGNGPECRPGKTTRKDAPRPAPLREQ